MKKGVLAVLLIGAAVVLVYYWQAVPTNRFVLPGTNDSVATLAAGFPARENSNAVALIQSNFAHVRVLNSNAVTAVVPAGPGSALEFTNFAPAIVLENVRCTVRQYGDMFGGNPVGTNPEITAALAGQNPKHINFLNAEAGQRVNANGELVDSWGTPLFFHQISGTEMEIHSAGPDRIMWTDDDLVAR